MHFLSSHIRRSFLRPEPLGKPRAAVRVWWRKPHAGALFLELHVDPIVLLKADALVFPLPEEIRIVASTDGEVIRPKGKFWVTIETFDPAHLVTDIF